MDEVNVTIVVLVPTQAGGYEPKEHPDYLINTHALARRLLSAILDEFKDKDGLDMSIEEVDLFIQAPNDKPLSNGAIPDNSRIIVMPKYNMANPLRKNRK